MKHTILSLVALLLAGLATSCNYLDIVPDGTATEKDAFANPKAAERYLYSCYGYIPSPGIATTGLDFLTGDEVATSFEHELFANFPKGSYSATSPIISYWNDLFTGIRYCYILIDKVDAVPNIDKDKAADYQAQAEFLIGYYHYLLIQNYGPTVLIQGIEDVNVPAQEFRPRVPLDQCVDFVAKKLDDAAAKLPAQRSGNEYGLATSVIAKAVKAKLLTMVASPLFNGNSEYYSDFKDKEGNALMPLTYDQSKWERAYTATKEAIDAAHAIGHKLYYNNGSLSNIKEPSDPTQRSLRLALLDKENSTEIVWGDTRGTNHWQIQGKSAPIYKGKPAWGGVGPTLTMMKRFYTDKGLPIDEDPDFPTPDHQWELMNVPADCPYAEDRIPRFLYNREPRLYAWTTFHNGYYEIGGVGGVNDEKNQYSKHYQRGENRLVMKFLSGQPSGRSGGTNNNYSPTGFLNKKLVHPLKTPDEYFRQYIHPYIQLSDLYLLYAEAAVELGKLDEAKEYLDLIRKRAGIDSVDVSWAKAKNPSKATTKEGMREIVRQERMIELYLTNQNFWDLRRWKIADHYFGIRPVGMDISKDRIEEFTRPTEVNIERAFVSPRNYLMPIPQGEIDKNIHLVQNPGY